MINKEFKSVMDLIEAFPDEQLCIDHLETLRWEGEVISPFDPDSKVYKCKNNCYRCKNTGKYFNVKTDTLFDNTKVPLQKWFLAIYLVTSHKKGISSVQLSKDIDVTQKTAWFMLQRIRNCFGLDDDEKMTGTVEADETFVGGKNKNRHADKKVQYSQGRSFKDKTPVLGLLERESKKLKLIVIPSTARRHIQPLVGKYVAKGSRFYSDEWKAYRGLDVRYDHCYIDHSKKQYCDGDIHTNTIEGFWSIFKRGIIGIYHKVTRKHLQLYCNEFEFRYNSIKLSASDRFNAMLNNMEHRLRYKELIACQ